MVDKDIEIFVDSHHEHGVIPDLHSLCHPEDLDHLDVVSVGSDSGRIATSVAVSEGLAVPPELDVVSLSLQQQQQQQEQQEQLRHQYHQQHQHRLQQQQRLQQLLLLEQQHQQLDLHHHHHQQQQQHQASQVLPDELNLNTGSTLPPGFDTPFGIRGDGSTAASEPAMAAAAATATTTPTQQAGPRLGEGPTPAAAAAVVTAAEAVAAAAAAAAVEEGVSGFGQPPPQKRPAQTRRCQHSGPGGCSRRPSFNHPGSKAAFCSAHRQLDMVDVAHKLRCQHPQVID